MGLRYEVVTITKDHERYKRHNKKADSTRYFHTTKRMHKERGTVGVEVAQYDLETEDQLRLFQQP